MAKIMRCSLTQFNQFKSQWKESYVCLNKNGKRMKKIILKIKNRKLEEMAIIIIKKAMISKIC